MTTAQLSLERRPAKEGIFFIIRAPLRWKLICHAFKKDEDFSHYDWWQNEVAGFVARKWKTVFRRSQSQTVEDVKLLTYAFPRGTRDKDRERFSDSPWLGYRPVYANIQEKHRGGIWGFK